MNENSEFLENQAKEILIDPRDEEPLASIILFVFSQQGAPKHTIHSFKRLFKYCIYHHPNHLALKLSKIVKSPSENRSLMAPAVFLIYALLLKTPVLKLSTETLSELKHTILVTLQQQIFSSGFPFLAAVISLIAYNSFKEDNGEWTDYLDYVDSLINHPSHFKKGLWLVIEFPLNMPSEMVVPYFCKIQDKIFSYLDSPHEEDKDGDISAVAFAASFPLMIILVRLEISRNLFNRLKKSITGLVKKGRQVVLLKGINILSFYASKKLWLINDMSIKFVRTILTHMMIVGGIDKQTTAIIQRLVDEGLATSATLYE